MTNHQDLIPHLFRTEYSKMTAVLCTSFGLDHLETAEDIVSEVFQSALETWPYRGVPANPVAWLYTVAKNKARNVWTRQERFREKVAQQYLEKEVMVSEPEIDLSERNITDSQLQMLFAICHPSIPPEAQVGLALRILCGFSIDEIAHAFLTGRETINKRLFRAREKLRQEKVQLCFPAGTEIPKRLDSVLTALYLLFSEGYASESHEVVLREELCLEAMRLTYLLLDYPRTNLPHVNALMALMCFQASRFAARKNTTGEMVLYHDQDQSLWDETLISRGAYYLHRAAQGDRLSSYHLEAAIAFWHTHKADSTEKWEHILTLYDQLLQQHPSPVAALNRTYALSRVKGSRVAIAEAEKLTVHKNQYYYTLLGELYRTVDTEKARDNLLTALSQASTQADKTTIIRKLSELG